VKGPEPSSSRLPVEIQLPDSPEWIARVRENAERYMRKYENCPQSILEAFMDEFGMKDPMVTASAGALHGMSPQLMCGVYTAGLMVLGLLMGRRDVREGLDSLTPIVMPAQDLITRLHDRIGGYTCTELTRTDFDDDEQRARYYTAGGQEQCISRVGQAAEEIGRFIRHLDETGDLFRPNLR